MKLFMALTLALTFTGSVMACSEDGSSGFLPENDLSIPVGVKSAGGITERQFNDVIDRLETIYTPIAARMGGKLVINRKWEDPTVNANATRLGNWSVNMYGGLARHKAITVDGFALVLCHEIGHHIGGAPKVNNFLTRWASNEGQSDYFATLKCLREVFKNDNNRAVLSRVRAPMALARACRKAWSNTADYHICLRSGLAGASVSALFASLENKPEAKFETPDSKVVARTNDDHPAHQCRLDTFFQGALCEVSANEDVSQTDEVRGTCHGSLGHDKGLRPLCWYKPKK